MSDEGEGIEWTLKINSIGKERDIWKKKDRINKAGTEMRKGGGVLGRKN